MALSPVGTSTIRTRAGCKIERRLTIRSSRARFAVSAPPALLGRAGLTQALGRRRGMATVTRKINIKNVALSVLGALFLAYALVVIFLMFGPTYINGELSISQSGKFTAIIAPFVVVPLYLLLERRERNRKICGR